MVESGGLRPPTKDTRHFLSQQGRGGGSIRLWPAALRPEQDALGVAGLGLPGAKPSNGIQADETVVRLGAILVRFRERYVPRSGVAATIVMQMLDRDCRFSGHA
jgi:hypothetical protein